MVNNREYCSHSCTKFSQSRTYQLNTGVVHQRRRSCMVEVLKYPPRGVLVLGLVPRPTWLMM